MRRVLRIFSVHWMSEIDIYDSRLFFSVSTGYRATPINSVTSVADCFF